MKILITGVSGFIGKGLYHTLSSKYDVYGVSRTLLDKKNCTVLDFLNKKNVKNYFNDNQFDVIINLASTMASPANAKNMELFQDNLNIQTNIIEALKDYEDCVFINFSSSAVYPNIDGEFSENGRIEPSYNPDCLYGLAKFNSEILFKFFFNESIKLINLRVGYVYGDEMNSTRIHKVFERELMESNTISVFGNGERTIPQIEIKELIRIVTSFIKKPVAGVFNIAKENVSLVEIAKRIIEKKGNEESKIINVEKGNRSKFKLNLDIINSIP